MTSINISANAFPAGSHNIQAMWAPILLEPIAGSYERLIIGCAVVNDHSFHIEAANSLYRLGCLYGDRAEGVIFAVNLAYHAIRQDIATRGLLALTDARPPLSGIHIGETREAEGGSLEAIARDWLAVLSSLHDTEVSSSSKDAGSALGKEPATTARTRDRLPQLVLEHISRNNLALARHFSQRIISGSNRRRNAAHKVDIDFSGRRLVANFATLNAGRIAPAVGNIKQRLWDLKFHREQEATQGELREHELIIQVPRPDDPQVTTKQYERLKSEYEGLLGQADQLELILREFNTADQIGNHVMEREAA